MSKLYEITGKMLELQAKLEETENESTKKAIETTIESLDFDFEEKVDNCLKLVKNYESDVDSINNEIARLQALKKSKQSNVDNIKEYLKENFITLGKNKVETALFKVSVKKNPPAVNIIHEEDIDIKYLVLQDPKIDKKKILDDLKAGIEVRGCEMTQGISLMIK